jgi:hypothetical protein
VFKSGVVAVTGRREVCFFDQRGERLGVHRAGMRPISLEKYYDFGSREFLIGLFESGTVKVFDLATFDVIGEYGQLGQIAHICGVKRARAFLAAAKDGTEIIVQSFADRIGTVFSKTQKIPASEPITTPPRMDAPPRASSGDRAVLSRGFSEFAPR